MTRYRVARIVCLLLFLSMSLWAASGYDIVRMHSDLRITEQGVYEVDERIVMDFHTPLHGFYRVLPVDYRFEDGLRDRVKVRVSAVKASDTFSVMREGSYVTIRVGDADRTVTGMQEYAISYRYDIGEDPYAEYDEFYFNIVGEDWQVPIGAFSFSITFPSPVSADRIHFTRGVWGTTSAEGVSWNLSADGTVLTGNSTTLDPGEAVTVRVEMPQGYFLPRTDWQAIYKIPFLLVLLALVILAWLSWNRYGRDKDLIIVPRFSPPEGMSPLDVGYIIDESLDPKDVTAMIFYWADKGCLTIVEDGKKFSFIKGNDPKGATKHEMQMFNDFFSSGSKGVVGAKDLEGKFFVSYQKLRKTIDHHYRGERALASVKSRNKAALTALMLIVPAIAYALITTGNHVGPETFVLFAVALFVSISFLVLFHVMMRAWHISKAGKRLFWFALFVFVFAFGGLLLFFCGFMADSPVEDILYAVPLHLFSSVPLALFAIITIQRSEFGRRKLEEILGFRDFIEKVEMDQLKRMIEEDPAFYYHMLSFAIVLGLEKKWANKFSSITLEPPSWYMGNHTVWNAMVLSSMLNRCNTALLSSVVTTPKSSPGSRFGGSSFGGGGFSGGGFGGGGGGAW
ncbi:MAG: DUF2207 domain-containing protein [Sphaerochaetaceae bacterium]|nr:DUF2207 domain-containing protein [Sphaerochaetaceae bacterium]